MTVDLAALLGPSGVRPLRDVVTQVDASSVTRWLACGRLLRPLPGVLATPEAMGTWRGRATAAVTWSGGTLSGRTALTLWDLTGHPGARLHLAVGRRRNVPPVPDWLLPHRVDVPGRCVRDGLPVTPVAAALLETWGHAHGRSAVSGDLPVARAAVIGAVRRRQVPLAALQREVGRHPLLPGRRGLVELVDLIAGGCQSEFEIWGLRHLLDVPGLPPVQQQFALETRIGTIRLDAAWKRARLGVELDGAQYHRGPDQREYDLRRDAAALAEGWVTLRVSHRRAHAEPDVCRAEIAATHAARLGLA